MGFAKSVFELKRATVLRSSQQLDRSLARAERLPPDELRTLADQRAIDAARFAFEHTRFYRDHYGAAGLTPADLRDPAAFSSLPVVEKHHVREQHDLFVSDERTPRNSTRSVTGGSTGEPLTLLRDLRFQARALEWRLLRWWGAAPFEDVAVVTRHVRSPRQARLHAVQWWPTRRIQLDASSMDDASIQQFLQRWRRVRPAIMIGYVGAIAELADVLERRGWSVPPPKVVAVTAAPLHPNQREQVERVFGAPVYDHYRSSEVPWVAGECREQRGLHVFSDVRRVEVVDAEDRPVPTGVTGAALVSDLTNRVFPLLRYRLGDRTASLPGECPCGVSLPRIEPVAGRETDVLRLPGGRVVAGEGLAQLFSRHLGAVKQFQIRQAADHSIRLLCVPAGPGSHRDIEVVADNLRAMVDGEVDVSLELVDAIPHDRGKVRYLVTEVRPDR